jgi:hypothetical protein
MKREAGQSMVEFAVGASALSLLLLGMLTLGGYQEADRRGVLAARQSAWHESWSPGTPDTEARAALLHQHFLTDSAVHDPTGRDLLVAAEDVVLEAGRSAPAGVAGGAAQMLLVPLRTVSGFLGSGFDLAEGGLVHGSVRARIAPLPHLPSPFDALDIQLQAPYALLGDAWHAGGIDHVGARAGGLVPASRLAALNAIWQPLSVPIGIVEPSLRRLCFGLIEPDRIPEDRLGPGHSPLPGGCP